MEKVNTMQDISTKALLDELEARGVKCQAVPVQPDDTPDFIGQMIDIVEDFLEEKKVTIDHPEKENEPDESAAIIYGSDYDALAEKFKDLMKSYHFLTETANRILIPTENNEHYLFHEYETTYICAKLLRFYLTTQREFKDGTFYWALCCELTKNFRRNMIIDHVRGSKEDALARLEKIVSTGTL